MEGPWGRGYAECEGSLRRTPFLSFGILVWLLCICTAFCWLPCWLPGSVFLSRLLCSSVVPKKLHFTSCWTRTCSGSPRQLSRWFGFFIFCTTKVVRSGLPHKTHCHAPALCSRLPTHTHTHTHVRTQIQLETWFVGSTCLLTFNFISLLLRWFLSVTIQTGKSRSIRIFYYSQIFYNVMKRQFKRLFSKKKDFQIEIEGSSFLNDGLHCSYSFEHFAYSSLICSFAHCFYQCRPQPVQLAVCKVFGQLGLFVVALASLCFPGGRRRILKGCRKRLNLILLGFLCILEPTSECWHSVFA